MKHSLMAAAVAGALVAPGLALAQATTSGTNVQIYGVFDVRFDQMKFTEGTGSGVTAGVPSSVRKSHVATGAPNRIGFRGTESLGNGLQTFFQVETQVFTDARFAAAAGSGAATNATLGGRPTFVGLRGGWGEVSAGYQDSVYKDVWKTSWSVNPTQGHFGIIMNNGNTSGLTATPNCAGNTCASGHEGNTTSFNRTVSNTLVYRSPVIAGFRFAAMMAANELKEPSSSTPAGTAQSDPRLGAYSLTWAGGPFAVAAAYEQHTGFRAGGAGTVRDAKDKGFTVGARWNFGPGRIGVGWEKLKYENTVLGAATNGFELKNWVVTGAWNLTPSDVIGAGYSKTPGATNCGAGLTSTQTAPTAGATGAPTCGSGTGSKMWTLSIDHAFSKRTAIYALYSKVDNNAGANYAYISMTTSNNTGGTGTGNPAVGVDINLMAVGIKHSF